MATQDKPKKVKGLKNPDRHTKTSKAWKKHPKKPKSKTPERLAKDIVIQMQRDNRRRTGMARHAEEQAILEGQRQAKEAQRLADLNAKLLAQANKDAADRVAVALFLGAAV